MKNNKNHTKNCGKSIDKDVRCEYLYLLLKIKEKKMKIIEIKSNK